MPTSDEILQEKQSDFYRFLAECVKVAEHRGPVPYEAIGEVIEQPAINTRHWAAAVPKEVAKGDHPMLSAVIVGKNDGTPGEGFYNLAHGMGRLSQDPEMMSKEEKLEFWQSELKQVHETFAK